MAEYLLTLSVPRREIVAPLTEISSLVRYFNAQHARRHHATTTATTAAAATTAAGGNNSHTDNHNNNTAAVSRGRPVSTIDQLIHPLTAYRAKPYLRDARGRNALALAAENGHVRLVDLCLKIGLDAGPHVPSSSSSSSSSSLSVSAATAGAGEAAVAGAADGGDGALHLAARRGHRAGTLSFLFLFARPHRLSLVVAGPPLPLTHTHTHAHAHAHILPHIGHSPLVAQCVSCWRRPSR